MPAPNSWEWMKGYTCVCTSDWPSGASTPYTVKAPDCLDIISSDDWIYNLKGTVIGICVNCAAQFPSEIPTPPTGVDEVTTTTIDPLSKWSLVTNPHPNIWRCLISTSVKDELGGFKSCSKMQGNILIWQHPTKKSNILCLDCAAKVTGANSNTASTKLKHKQAKCFGCKEKFCNACFKCHTDGCKYDGYRVATSGDKLALGFIEAKTQKVQGYVALSRAGLPMPKPFHIIMEDSDIESVLASRKERQVFVRPCPTRPRHGFVDSRPMDITKDSATELRELFEKAKASDETGCAELLVVPFIKSDFNAIVTPTRIAVGPGHDGATAGRSSMSIPLAGVGFPQITPALLKESKVNVDSEDPYIEAVVASNQVLFTQLRAGVKIPSAVGTDFVPRVTRVLEVIDASGDLLEWEAQTKRITDGTVVCHLGGTLISHYGVHCMQNGIPVFTSRRPEIGEILEVIGKPDKPNPEDVIRGLADGAVVPMKDFQQYNHAGDVWLSLISMMTTLHNSAVMSGKDGYWLGVAVSIMFRAGMAASHGEARHKGFKHIRRDKVYALAFKNFIDTREALGRAQWKFKYMPWSSSFGGKAWATCTDAIIKMDNAARRLMNDPTDENVSLLITELNNAVNQAHNGGWWLNKFIEQHYFDLAAQQNLTTVVLAAIGFYKIQNLVKDFKTESAELLDKWRAARDIEIIEGKSLIGLKTDYSSDEHSEENDDESPCDCPDCNPPGDSLEEEIITDFSTVEHEGYVGVLCLKCGAHFEFCNKDEIGAECGKGGCNGHCVWYENGKTFTSYHFEGGPNKLTKYTNVNDLASIASDAIISGVQGSFHMKSEMGPVLHLQWKTDKTEGYYSKDLVINKLNIDLSKWKSQEQCESYSGSGNNTYIKFECTKGILEGAWQWMNKELNIIITCVPYMHIYHVTNLIEEPNEQTQEIIKTEDIDVVSDEDIPF